MIDMAEQQPSIPACVLHSLEPSSTSFNVRSAVYLVTLASGSVSLLENYQFEEPKDLHPHLSLLSVADYPPSSSLTIHPVRGHRSNSKQSFMDHPYLGAVLFFLSHY